MRPKSLLRQPLIRLLVVNLAGGVAITFLMLGGLLALNPSNLRGLILADRDGFAALALLACGLLITFGSAAMGSAIMALTHQTEPGDRARGKRVHDRMHGKVLARMHAKVRARH